MPKSWNSEFIVIQGRTEVESNLLKGIIQQGGVQTFHVPSAASALMGRTTSFRFAVKITDRKKVENILNEMSLKLEDYMAVRSAYNLDEPFHKAFSHSGEKISIATIVLTILGIFFVIYILGLIR